MAPPTLEVTNMDDINGDYSIYQVNAPGTPSKKLIFLKNLFFRISMTSSCHGKRRDNSP